MKVFASLAAVLTLASAGAASAQDVRIPYGDLDLSSASGAAAFNRRIVTAGREACRGAFGRLDYSCVRRLRNEAISELPDVRRTEYASARSRDARLVASTPRAPAT